VVWVPEISRLFLLVLYIFIDAVVLFLVMM